MTEQIGEAILGILLPQSSTAYNVLLYFVEVALSEEGFKYLLLKKRTWYSSEFNCQFDGVVYAVFVALGFCPVGEYQLCADVRSRARRLSAAVTAAAGHACFGVFMARLRPCQALRQLWRRVPQPPRRRLAVLVPVLLHGTYDFIATYEYDGYAWIFVVFVVLLFAAAYRMIKKLSCDDRFIDDSDYYHYDGPEF